jgi:prepilin-type N-terminal cleavage/methylation domain-containing protein/prepilin-type processing-associated H-X9-DG protein
MGWRCKAHRDRNCSKRRPAFTLVELLVVIGIIALLIAILLPALSKARRQSLQVKCASALRQVGMGFQLYSNDQNGWWPVAKLDPTQLNPTITTYYIGNDVFTANTPAYWYNFIGPYVAAASLGYASTSAANQAQANDTVIWGCPAWTGYISTTSNTTTTVQPGFGMNDCPGFQMPGTPNGSQPASAYVIITGKPGGSTGTAGNFYKQTQWTVAASRALVADSIFWIDECNPPAYATSYTAAVSTTGQPAGGNVNTYTPNITDQTLVDIYRHGTKPGVINPGVNAQYNPNGGQVMYNILYCDGHVSEVNDAQEAYRSYRMRFPN